MTHARVFGIGLFLLVLAAPSTILAASIIINFDDQPQFGNVVITNQYPQATFSSELGFVNYVTTQSQFNGTKPNFLCTGPVGESIDCSHQTIVDFASPVSNLTFQALGIDNTGPVANVDVFVNTILDSTFNINGSAEGLNPLTVDLSAFTNVTSIKIYNITDGAGIGWDTFSFNQGTSVPEPASLLLLGTGLVGIGLAASRRKR